MEFRCRGGVTFKFLAAMLVVFCLGVGSASADVTEVPLESATGGIAVGPDGNIWAAEPFAEQVVRISPTGAVLARYPLAGEPEGVTAGPGGRVWVAVTGSAELVWFDALAPAPSPHPISTTGVSKCDPVALANGGDGFIYFSAPSTDGMCNAGVSAIGRVAADGTGAVKGLAGVGEAFGLAAYGGKLFVPDFGGDAVRRIAEASFGPESTIGAPGGSAPAAVAVSPSGEVWTSLLVSNQIARFPVTQNGGNATVLPLAPGLLSEPSGIGFGTDGAAYVASTRNSSLVRIDAAGAAISIPMPAGSEPYEVAPSSDGSVWVSDIGAPRVLRYTAPQPPAPPSPSPSPGSSGSGSPAPSAPTAPAPRAIIGGKKSQALSDSVSVVASCSAGTCQATASGNVVVKARGSKAKSYPLRAVKASLSAGRKATLKLKLPAKTKKAVKAAVEGGGTATAKVQLTVSDVAGTKSAPVALAVKLTAAGKPAKH